MAPTWAGPGLLFDDVAQKSLALCFSSENCIQRFGASASREPLHDQVRKQSQGW